MKKTTLILNWLFIIFIVVSSFITLITCLTAKCEAPIELGIIGGADGPTAIFLATDINPLDIIFPLLLALLLLMNIAVIKKQKQ